MRRVAPARGRRPRSVRNADRRTILHQSSAMIVGRRCRWNKRRFPASNAVINLAKAQSSVTNAALSRKNQSVRTVRQSKGRAPGFAMSVGQRLSKSGQGLVVNEKWLVVDGR